MRSKTILIFHTQRLDIKGNDFDGVTKKYYKEKLSAKGEEYLSALSHFDSEDEEDEE